MKLINSLKRAPSKSLWAALIVSVATIAGTFNGVFSYVAFLLSWVAVVELSEEDALCFLTFIMPFANIFKPSAGSQSFFTYLLLFYVLWYFLKRRSVDKRFLFSFLVLIVFLFAQSLFSFHVLRIIKFLANIMFIYLAINTNMQEDNKRIYLSYIFGTLLASLTAVLNVIPNLESFIGSKNLGAAYDNVARFTGLYSDPNYYSVNLIISLCLVVVLYHKKQIGSIVALILSVSTVGFAVITFSKSAFLMLVLPLLLLLYSKIKSHRYFAFVVVLTIGIVLIINILAGKIELFDTVMARFEAGNLTTGRVDLWMDYLDYWQRDPLGFIFGVGFDGEMVGKAAHNTYIDIFYYLGIVGVVPLSVVFVAMTNTKSSIGRHNFLNYGVVICLVFMYFFLSELFYFDWAFHVTIAILVAKMNIE